MEIVLRNGPSLRSLQSLVSSAFADQGRPTIRSLSVKQTTTYWSTANNAETFERRQSKANSARPWQLFRELNSVWLLSLPLSMVPGVEIHPRFTERNVNAHVAIQYRVSDASTLFYMGTRARCYQVEEGSFGRTALNSIRSNLLGQLHDGVRPSTVRPLAVKLNRRET